MNLTPESALSILISIISLTYLANSVVVKRISSHLDNKITEGVKWAKGELNRPEEELEEWAKVQIGRKAFNGITQYISLLEQGLGSLIFLGILLQNGSNLLEAFETSIPLAGGWMLIKVIGNYSMWSRTIIGRASFYKFLIGSLASLLSSALVAITIHFLLIPSP